MEKETVRFSDLKVGECFHAESWDQNKYVWMKINNKESFNAMYLKPKNGFVCTFSADSQMRLYRAEKEKISLNDICSHIKYGR